MGTDLQKTFAHRNQGAKSRRAKKTEKVSWGREFEEGERRESQLCDDIQMCTSWGEKWEREPDVRGNERKQQRYSLHQRE